MPIATSASPSRITMLRIVPAWAPSAMRFPDFRGPAGDRVGDNAV